ncbi:MAG: isoprenylcysteine carboxylmethyltransferase family protein [Planctomycetota bacterium]
MFRRVAIFIYGVAAYGVGFSALLYTIAFIGGYGAPTQLDDPSASLSAAQTIVAVLVNLGLVLLFGLQHSGMARPAFKRWWTQYVPTEAERSTYLVATGAALAVMFAFWQPIGGVVWSIDSTPIRYGLHAAYFAGWAIVFLASFLIDHFDLFGLPQVWLCLRGKPYQHVPFCTPMLYSHLRHPIYAGVLLASWSAPSMGPSRLLFALAMTAYVLKAIRWEERDLVAHLGERYTAYQSRVAMLLPRFGQLGRSESEAQRRKAG